jgi:hypothetical protein
MSSGISAKFQLEPRVQVVLDGSGRSNPGGAAGPDDNFLMIQVQLLIARWLRLNMYLSATIPKFRDGSRVSQVVERRLATTRPLFCKRISQEPQTQLSAVHVQYSEGERNGYGPKIAVQGGHRLGDELRV